jgi:dihydropteroate synthase
VEYEDMMGEIFNFLSDRVDYAVDCGIEPERIIVDPGIGFGKSPEGNLEIIKRLPELKALGRPILVGTSRKSFIGNIIGADVDRRLAGTLATVAASILAGAHIVRVHDVKEAVQAARMADALKNGQVFEMNY